MFVQKNVQGKYLKVKESGFGCSENSESKFYNPDEET